MLNMDFNPIRFLLSAFAAPDDDTILLDPEDMDTEEMPAVQCWQVGDYVLTPGFGWRDSLFSGVIKQFGAYPDCGENEGADAAYITALDGSAAAWMLLNEIAPVWALSNLEVF